MTKVFLQEQEIREVSILDNPNPSPFTPGQVYTTYIETSAMDDVTGPLIGLTKVKNTILRERTGCTVDKEGKSQNDTGNETRNLRRTVLLLSTVLLWFPKTK